MGLGIVGAPATVPTLDAAEGVAPERQCLHGLIVRYWQAAYDGQRDVTGRAGLMPSRTAPVCGASANTGRPRKRALVRCNGRICFGICHAYVYGGSRIP